MTDDVYSDRLRAAAAALIVVSDLERDRVERDRVERARRRGELVTLSRGVHVPATRWNALTVDDRFRLRSMAAQPLLTADEVLSHHSAAALHGLPIIGDWPTRAESTLLCSTGLTSTGSLRRHRVVRPPRAELLQGIPATTLAQTVVDLAAERTLSAGVAICDAALRMLARSRDASKIHGFGDELAAIAAALGTGRGSARVRQVLAFADPLAESPGESITRVALHLLGVPAPVLQHPVVGVSGRVWRVDLAWPQLGIVLEFDGKSKYLDPRYRNGRTMEQVLYDEKKREDDIRPRVRAFGRVDWPTVTNPSHLAAMVSTLGLPLGRRGRTVLV